MCKAKAETNHADGFARSRKNCTPDRNLFNLQIIKFLSAKSYVTDERLRWLYLKEVDDWKESNDSVQEIPWEKNQRYEK